MKRVMVGYLCLFCLSLAVGMAGCAERNARERPLHTSAVDSGADSTMAARKELEGSWALQSLDVLTEDGRRASVEASGVLTADGFGNLSIEYRLSEAGRLALQGLGINPPNPVISTSGRVVIDPQQHRITYMAPGANPFDADLAARRANPFALERPRYYALDQSGVLTLTARYDSGKDATIGRWTKNP